MLYSYNTTFKIVVNIFLVMHVLPVNTDTLHEIKHNRDIVLYMTTYRASRATDKHSTESVVRCELISVKRVKGWLCTLYG